MNLKPNNHKTISFNTTTMASLGFKGLFLKFRSPLKFSSPPPPPPPPPNSIFCSGLP